MEHFSNDDEDHPNQHENSHKQCNEMGHSVSNLLESQWKLKQQHDQTFPIEEKHQKKENKKSRPVRVTVRDPSRKVNHLSKVI